MHLRSNAAPVLCRDTGCPVSSLNSHLRDERRAQLPPLLNGGGTVRRPVALLMLVLTLLAHTSGPPQDEHLFWAALFGWYVAQGAGPLSLDHLLAKGLGLSPLPLAGRAMAAADWFDRWVGPLYRLAVRLWLAGAPGGG